MLSQIKTKSKQIFFGWACGEFADKNLYKIQPHTLNVKFYTKRERTEHVEYKSRTDFSFVGEKCFLCFCRSTWPSSLSGFPSDFLDSHTVRTFGTRTLPKHAAAAAPVAISGAAAAAQMHGKYTNERTCSNTYTLYIRVEWFLEKWASGVTSHMANVQHWKEIGKCEEFPDGGATQLDTELNCLKKSIKIRKFFLNPIESFIENQ